MTVVLGLLIVAFGVGLAIAMAGMLHDAWDGIVDLGFAIVLGSVVIGLVLFGVAFMFGALNSPPLVEGACYRAVRHTVTTTTPVIVGKSTILIPSQTSGLDLEEIRCP